MRTMRRPLVVLGATLALTSAGAAHANGRYPLANQLLIDPADPSHLVARSTFGLLDSRDDGASFGWLCENLIGSLGSTEDPSIGLTAGGTLLAASSVGLSASQDGGCSWHAAPGLPAGRFGVDLTVDPSPPHEAFAIESATVDGSYSLYLVKTSDDGASFYDVGSPLHGVIGETVEIAPSRSQRLYLSGLLASGASAIERSDDAGLSWTELPLTAAASSELVFVSAVDPHDADTLYVRIRSLTGAPGRLLVSHDAGASFSEIWSRPGDVAGFALSADGSQLAVGGPDSGLFVAKTSDYVFQKQGTLGPSCLAFRGDELFACANEGIDHFSIGVSTDLGAHFSTKLNLPTILPRTCASSTSTQICASQWAIVAPNIGADLVPATEAGTGADAGAWLDATSPIDARADASLEAPASSGCACRVGPPRAPRSRSAASRDERNSWLGLLLLPLVAVFRVIGRSRSTRRPNLETTRRTLCPRERSRIRSSARS
jgi:hypothetical protein